MPYFPPLPEAKPANVNYVNAFAKGYIAPDEMATSGLSNQLTQNKLTQFQNTQNALAEYEKTQDPGAFKGVDPELHIKLKNWMDSQPPEVLKDLPRATAVAQQIAPMLTSAAWKGGLHQKFTSAFPNLPEGSVPGPDATDQQLFQWANMAKLLDAQLKKSQMEPKVVGKSLVSPTGTELFRGPADKTTILGPGGAVQGSVEGKVTQLHQPLQGPKPEWFENPENPKEGGWVKPGQQPPAGWVPKSQVIGMAKETEKTEDKGVLAQMLIDGDMVPATLSKRGDYNSIIALAKKKDPGFSPAQLSLKWEGAKRWQNSLNSSQQARLETAGMRVVHTIDRLQELAQEMNLSGFQPLNYAELQTKIKTAGNTKAGQLATQYVTTVNDLKEVFATAANGGYAPTDSVWKLANSQINENFGVKQMDASLSELKRLMNININAGKEMREGAAVWNPTGKTNQPPAGQSTAANVTLDNLPVGKATRIRNKVVGRFADGLYYINPQGKKLGRYE